MSAAHAADLAGRTGGPVWSATDPDAGGYDGERHGFNVAVDHRPAIILPAATAADIVEGVRFAAEHGLPVDLQATGHGAHQAMDGGLLITTRHMTDVQVDSATATARVAVGATSGAVTAAAARYGLAAPVGSAPGVGFTSYALGGGLGSLGRTYGYAADHVRRLDVVAADGRDLVVTRDQHPDLFWALRGGGGNFAAVTALEIDLLPVSELYGGGLFFPGAQAPAVMGRFTDCIATAPPELSLSIAFLTLPNLPQLPEPLRGRFCCHVRVAYLGDAEAGQRLIAGLRELTPIVDTVRTMPVTDIGTINGDPVGPMPINDNSLALAADTALDRMLPYLDPDAPFMLELRHLGGALAGRPEVDNAVGHRAARLNLFTSAFPGTDSEPAAAAQQRVYDAVASAGIGGPLRNFLPAGDRDASRCYEPAIVARLLDLKATWDPGDTFRYAPSLSAGGAATS